VDIGVPKEIKSPERRVALTPAAVRELVTRGHTVLVGFGAVVGAGFADAAFEIEGARLVRAADVWAGCDLVVKVKESQLSEVRLLRPGQTVFGYLHLAANQELTASLVESGATAIAFETVTGSNGRLPLLAPMSEVAGRLAVQYGAMHLLASKGGRGVLAGGVAGVRPARGLVIGGGVVGENAALVAVGLGLDTVVADRNVERLRQLDAEFHGRLRTVAATEHALEQELAVADLVIGAVLSPGALAPKIIRREHLPLLGITSYHARRANVRCRRSRPQLCRQPAGRGAR
jgi:alanine dehydrogenase